MVENTPEVSGGGLDGQYSVLQFHFHWGTETDGGSEHTVDDHRFKMEVRFCKIFSIVLFIYYFFVVAFFHSIIAFALFSSVDAHRHCKKKYDETRDK